MARRGDGIDGVAMVCIESGAVAARRCDREAPRRRRGEGVAWNLSRDLERRAPLHAIDASTKIHRTPRRTLVVVINPQVSNAIGNHDLLPAELVLRRVHGLAQ